MATPRTPRTPKAKAPTPTATLPTATKYEPEAQYRIKLSSVAEAPGGIRLKPGEDNVVVGWVAEVVDWAITSSEKVA